MQPVPRHLPKYGDHPLFGTRWRTRGARSSAAHVRLCRYLRHRGKFHASKLSSTQSHLRNLRPGLRGMRHGLRSRRKHGGLRRNMPKVCRALPKHGRLSLGFASSAPSSQPTPLRLPLFSQRLMPPCELNGAILFSLPNLGETVGPPILLFGEGSSALKKRKDSCFLWR